jgi:hypothetical protein
MEGRLHSAMNSNYPEKQQADYIPPLFRSNSEIVRVLKGRLHFALKFNYHGKW